MRKLFFIIVMLLLSFKLNAQYMNVYNKGGNVYSIPTDGIDSVVVNNEHFENYVDTAVFFRKYFILPKNSLPTIDTSVADIGKFSKESTLKTGILYPATVNNECKEVSNFFRYSNPVRIPKVYPSYFGVKQATQRTLGFVIEFYADCNHMEIKSYAGFRCVIVVDGVKINEKELVSENGDGGFLYLPITFKEKKKRHIKIYYFGTSFMGIISDGEISKYEQKKLLMCVDGDSVVEGVAQVGIAEGTFGCWASCVAQILGFDLYNTGVGGSGFVAVGGDKITPNMPDRFDKYIAPYQPDILIFSAGINDPDSENFSQKVEEYFKKATGLKECKVIALSPYCNVAKPSYVLEKHCDVIKAMAFKYHVPFIDYMHCMTYDAFGNCITNNLGTDAYHNIITIENRSEFLNVKVDPTHPNARGHRYIGEYIAREVYKILNRLEGF